MTFSASRIPLIEPTPGPRSERSAAPIGKSHSPLQSDRISFRPPSLKVYAPRKLESVRGWSKCATGRAVRERGGEETAHNGRPGGNETDHDRYRTVPPRHSTSTRPDVRSARNTFRGSTSPPGTTKVT